MKAVYIKEPGKLEVIDVEKPSIKKDTQVLVKITAAGICGSDIHIFHGTHAYATYPRIIGHEGCGIVEEVGSAVTDLKPGDSVIIEPITGCGTCYACRHGRYNCCPDIKVAGVHIDGVMEEYFVTERNKLYKYDPNELTPVEAATAEPYTVGAQANAQANTQPGDLVLIHGAGPIGMIICDIAEKRGATVIVSEVNEDRLKIAKDFGAKYTINPKKEDLKEATRNQNGKFPEVVESLPSRKDRIDKLVTHVFPAEEAEKAFDTAMDKTSGSCKVVITF